MTFRLRALPLLAVLALAGTASAETLLIDRVQQEPMAFMPVRGMTMAQVQARFGEPAERLDPRGGQKHQWPTINRWSYPAFTVYFEKNKVVDAVVKKADADEIGPKPPIH
jgi:outer membrane protein assembly factor BamE (lipoprotein component of BamABCDE complex)